MNIINDTPFPEFLFYWVTPSRDLFATIVVRAQFVIPASGLGDLAPCEEQDGPQLVDTWYGLPGVSSLRSEHDRTPYKSRGELYFIDPISRCPDGQRSPEWTASIRIRNHLHFSFRVFGPRRYRFGVTGRTLTIPEPVAEVPVRYEFMYGGQDQDDPSNGCKQNPVGCGFLLDSGAIAGDGRAPQIEHYTSGAHAGPPAITPLNRAWTPRREFAGTFDEHWAASRWPLFPEDFSPDFYQQSPPHLQLPAGFFSGDEIVEISGLGKCSAYCFQLPEERPLSLGVAHGPTTFVQNFDLDTVVVDLEQSSVSIVYRTVVKSTSVDSVLYIAFADESNG